MFGSASPVGNSSERAIARSIFFICVVGVQWRRLARCYLNWTHFGRQSSPFPRTFAEIESHAAAAGHQAMGLSMNWPGVRTVDDDLQVFPAIAPETMPLGEAGPLPC